MCNRKTIFSILLVGVFLLINCFFTDNTFASDFSLDQTAWNDGLFRKGILASAQKCYNSNFFKDEVDASTITKNGFYEIINNSGQTVALPSGYGQKDEAINTVSCEDIFFGGEPKIVGTTGDITSIFKISGLFDKDYSFYEEYRSPSDVEKVMSTLGYKKVQNDNRQYAITFHWDKFNEALQTHYQIYRKVSWDGSKLVVTDDADDNKPVKLQVDNKYTIIINSELKDDSFNDKGILNDPDRIVTLNVGNGCLSGECFKSAWDSFTSELTKKVLKLSNDQRGTFQALDGSETFTLVNDAESNDIDYVYSLEDTIRKSISSFVKNITGDQNFDLVLGLRYSAKEKISYYLNTIYKHYYNYGGRVYPYNDRIIECGGTVAGGISINVDSNGVRKKDCTIVKDENAINTISVWGFNESSQFDAKKSKLLNFEGVVAEINKLSENFDEGSDLTPTDPGTTTQETEADCYSADGLNGMAWVLCPTLYNLEGAAVGISGLIDNMLEVDARYYSSGSETETIWGYMRTIANTFLAIILVAVIFSQLTGYGIDNYGIKKLLPKFVIMVILINVSFLLCQIAIDISNILGQGLNNMFQTMASHDVTFGEVISMVTGGFIALITGAGAYSGLIASGIMAFTSGGNAAVIAVLVLSILAILVGVLIFFLMLGARMIIIILFTAISPIAFACYILPNTQKWFKNWWNVFKTALVMYPICGAVYGLSAVIRSIVFPGGASSVGIHPVIAIVAVLTPVLPYYIMPSLVKSTLSGLGAVGQFFNSIGNGLRKGISEGSHTLQNTGAYKSGTETSQRKMNTWRAGYSRNRKTGALEERKLNGFQKAIRGGKIGMSNAKAAMVRDEEKINAENNLNNDTLMARLDEVSSKQADLDAKSYETQLRSGKIEGVNADNADTVASNLTNLLEKYHKSGDKDERRVLMSKIRGAQAILAESKPGREKVQKAYEDAIKGGYDSALYGGNGAAHYYRQSAGASLNKTKSMDEMVTDLTKSMDNKASDAIRNNVENSYTNKALEKYNADTFASADSKELERYLANIDIMGDDEAGKNYKASLYKLINDAEKSETISISGQVQNLFNQMKAKIGPMPVAGASNGAAVENQEFKVQGVGSALASDQYATPQSRPTETSGQQMLRNGQQWANEVAQNGGTVTKSGIWIPESNNKKPSNPKPNNGGGVM